MSRCTVNITVPRRGLTQLRCSTGVEFGFNFYVVFIFHIFKLGRTFDYLGIFCSNYSVLKTGQLFYYNIWPGVSVHLLNKIKYFDHHLDCKLQYESCSFNKVRPGVLNLNKPSACNVSVCKAFVVKVETSTALNPYRWQLTPSLCRLNLVRLCSEL